MELISSPLSTEFINFIVKGRQSQQSLRFQWKEYGTLKSSYMGRSVDFPLSLTKSDTRCLQRSSHWWSLCSSLGWRTRRQSTYWKCRDPRRRNPGKTCGRRIECPTVSFDSSHYCLQWSVTAHHSLHLLFIIVTLSSSIKE